MEWSVLEEGKWKMIDGVFWREIFHKGGRRDRAIYLINSFYSQYPDGRLAVLSSHTTEN